MNSMVEWRRTLQLDQFKVLSLACCVTSGKLIPSLFLYLSISNIKRLGQISLRFWFSNLVTLVKLCFSRAPSLEESDSVGLGWGPGILQVTLMHRWVQEPLIQVFLALPSYKCSCIRWTVKVQLVLGRLRSCVCSETGAIFVCLGNEGGLVEMVMLKGTLKNGWRDGQVEE